VVDANANVCRFLAEMASAHPGKCALIEPRSGKSREWSFAEYAALVAGMAHLLQQKGIGRGCRTLVMVRPGLELVVLVFALFQLGAIPVVIDPGMGVKSFRRCVARTRPKALVGIGLAMAFSFFFHRDFDSVRIRLLVNRGLLKRVSQGSRLTLEPAIAEPGDLAAILFTSGSTGAPKGVCYEHRHFDAQLRLVREFYGIEPGEVDLPLLPVFSLFNPGLGMTTVVPPVNPSKPAKARPAEIVRVIQEHSVTNSFGSPVLWRLITRYCERQQIELTSLRRVLMAGASVPPELMESLKTVAPNAAIHSPYGATECLPISSITADEVLEETAQLTELGQGTCVGKVIPGISVRIQPLGDGAWIVPFGDERKVGEIQVSGPVVTEAYDQLPDATAIAKIREEDGTLWHRMGDLGYFDQSGKLWFCGRMVERVVRADGTTLLTDCCEAILNQHARIFRTALIGIGEAGAQVPAIVAQPENGLFPRDGLEKRLLLGELRALAKTNPLTENIEHFFLHRSFPVDVRHNAKIHRLTLAREFEGKITI
jgi:acyl-CoA synthetase (AMP-forming)/AMP-acid ligase II